MPFKPGQSGNPAGRPRGFRGVAAQIMAETDDGAELVAWALRVWRDPGRFHTHAERAAAHAWLSDRALGRPLQATELHAVVQAGPTLPSDWDSRSPESRRAYLDEVEAGTRQLAGAAATGLLVEGDSDE